MSTRAEAALALWNDVDPVRDEEYEQWHAIEHVPERVSAPGFLAATRYCRSLGDGPRYFTLYEICSLDALGTPEYRELVQHPTPWSASMRPSMSHFIRKPLALSVLAGVPQRGVGGDIVVVRAVWRDAMAGWAEQAARMAEQLMRSTPDVTRVGGGWVADAGPQAIANVQDAPAGNEAIVWAELEAQADASSLEQRRDELLRQMHATWPIPVWHQAAGYRPLTRVTQTHPAGAPRPAARMDLMSQYQGDNKA